MTNSPACGEAEPPSGLQWGNSVRWYNSIGWIKASVCSCYYKYMWLLRHRLRWQRQPQQSRNRNAQEHRTGWGDSFLLFAEHLLEAHPPLSPKMIYANTMLDDAGGAGVLLQVYITQTGTTVRTHNFTSNTGGEVWKRPLMMSRWCHQVSLSWWKMCLIWIMGNPQTDSQ